MDTNSYWSAWDVFVRNVFLLLIVFVPSCQLAQACRRLRMTDMAQEKLQLFQEIKKTKHQVRALYHETNRQPKPEVGEVPDKDASERNQ